MYLSIYLSIYLFIYLFIHSYVYMWYTAHTYTVYIDLYVQYELHKALDQVWKICGHSSGCSVVEPGNQGEVSRATCKIIKIIKATIWEDSRKQFRFNFAQRIRNMFGIYMVKAAVSGHHLKNFGNSKGLWVCGFHLGSSRSNPRHNGGWKNCSMLKTWTQTEKHEQELYKNESRYDHVLFQYTVRNLLFSIS